MLLFFKTHDGVLNGNKLQGKLSALKLSAAYPPLQEVHSTCLGGRLTAVV